MQIARGHFSGGLMHLRDIDGAFGKGSLRMLAAIRSMKLFSGGESERERHSEALASYFESTDMAARDADDIAYKNLGRVEYFLYLRHKYERDIDAAIMLASTLNGRLERSDPRGQQLLQGFSKISEMTSSLHYALEDIEEAEREKNPNTLKPQYSKEYLENNFRYMGRKRRLLRDELERLGLFG